MQKLISFFSSSTSNGYVHFIIKASVENDLLRIFCVIPVVHKKNRNDASIAANFLGN